MTPDTRWLDDIRRAIYRCSLLMITHILKTNFLSWKNRLWPSALTPAIFVKSEANLPLTCPKLSRSG